MKRHALVVLITLLMLASAMTLQAQTVRYEPQRVSGQCMADLMRSYELPSTAFEVGNIIDHTGVSLYDSTIPNEITFQVRSSLTSLSRIFGVVEPNVSLLEAKKLDLDVYKVDGAITQVDMNPQDHRRQTDTGGSFGGGRGEGAATLRSNNYDGSLAGCLVLQAYGRNLGFGLASNDSSSEVCFTVNRGQRGSEWSVTIGPLSFGKANVIRSNGAVHQAIRVAVDLAVTQLVGRSHGLPYWRCSSVFGQFDETLARDVAENIASLDETDLSAFRANILKRHGYAGHEYDRALRDAQSSLCPDGTCTEFDKLAWLHLYRPAFDNDVAVSGKPVTKARTLNWQGPGKARNAVQACEGEASPIGLGSRRTRISGRDPEYPQHAQEQGLEGIVQAKVVIDPLGKVVSVRVVNSVASGAFDKTVISAVRKWRFQPDQFALNDREVTIPFHFRLPHLGAHSWR